MRTFYYCSYDGSPVGFILGEVSKNGQLKNTDVPSLIEDSFKRGEINASYGKLHEDEYFILMKNLKTKGSASGNNPAFYLNIAFTTKNIKEFKNWLSQNNYKTKEDIAQLIKETIDISDRNNDFGLSVKPDKLSFLQTKSFHAFFDDVPEDNFNSAEENVFFDFKSEDSAASQEKLENSAREMKISEHYNGLTFTPHKGKWVTIGKKPLAPKPKERGILNIARNLNGKVIAAAVVMIILLIVLLIASLNTSENLPKKKEGNTSSMKQPNSAIILPKQSEKNLPDKAAPKEQPTSSMALPKQSEKNLPDKAAPKEKEVKANQKE